MSQASPILALPFLQPSQAQKHVTHNEALQRLDVLVQLRVEGFDALDPPAVPADGAVYALGSGPTGDWAGHGDSLAAWLGGVWQFFDPQPGWRAWGLAETTLRVWDGTAWAGLPPETQGLDGVGIGTTSDATNRLAVQAPATLLNHDGDGHQLKINKSADTATASLLFQSAWQGHAEMGLAGSTDFAIKVSADGAAWTDSLVVNATSGKLSGAGIAGLVGTVSESAGVPTGDIVERGSNVDGSYVRFADGTQICWVTEVDMGSIIAAGSGTWDSPYRTGPVNITWPAVFSEVPVAHATFWPGTAAEHLDSRSLVLNLNQAPAVADWKYLRVARMGSQTADFNVMFSATAIGRWF